MVWLCQLRGGPSSRCLLQALSVRVHHLLLWKGLEVGSAALQALHWPAPPALSEELYLSVDETILWGTTDVPAIRTLKAVGQFLTRQLRLGGLKKCDLPILFVQAFLVSLLPSPRVDTDFVSIAWLVTPAVGSFSAHNIPLIFFFLYAWFLCKHFTWIARCLAFRSCISITHGAMHSLLQIAAPAAYELYSFDLRTLHVSWDVFYTSININFGTGALRLVDCFDYALEFGYMHLVRVDPTHSPLCLHG